MGWVEREVDVHKCVMPKYDSSIKGGDIWQCDECKAQYEVTVGFDQLDDHWYLVWKQLRTRAVM